MKGLTALFCNAHHPASHYPQGNVHYSIEASDALMAGGDKLLNSKNSHSFIATCAPVTIHVVVLPFSPISLAIVHLEVKLNGIRFLKELCIVDAPQLAFEPHGKVIVSLALHH